MGRGRVLVILGVQDQAASVRTIIIGCALRPCGLRISCRRRAVLVGPAITSVGTRLGIRPVFSPVLNATTVVIGICGGSQVSHVLVNRLNPLCGFEILLRICSGDAVSHHDPVRYFGTN